MQTAASKAGDSANAVSWSAVAQGIEAYRALSSKVFSVQVTVPSPTPRGRSIRLEAAAVDRLAVSYGAFPSLALINPAQDRPSGDGRHFLYFTDQKHEVQAEDRRAFQVQPNEMVLLDSATPWSLKFARPFGLTALAIDSDWLAGSFPASRDMIGRRLIYAHNLDKALNGLLRAAQSIAEAGRFAPAAPDIAQSLLHLMALMQLPTTAAPPRDGVQARAARRDQTKRFIEQHYASPHLTVAAIAERLRLSPRYLQMAFAEEDSSPGEYLRHCRLAAGARLLADPRHQGRSITDIAFACGFSASGHFSTQFKGRYGVSPRAYRRGGEDG